MASETRQRIDLCPRAALVGNIAVVLIFLGLLIPTAFMPKGSPVLAAVLFLICLASIGPMLWAGFGARGKTLVVSDDDCTLEADGHEVWRVRWRDIVGTRSSSTLALRLIDAAGHEYVITTINLQRSAQAAIRMRVGAGAQHRVNSLRVNVPAPLGLSLLGAGSALILLGAVEWSRYASLLRKISEGAEDPSAVGPPWHLLVLAAGIVLTAFAALDLLATSRPRWYRRATEQPSSRGYSLARHLGVGTLGPLFDEPIDFHPRADAPLHSRRALVIVILANCLFDGVFISLIVAGIVNGAVWYALAAPYGILALFALASFRSYAATHRTLAWQARCLGGEVTAISPEGVEYRTRIRRIGQDLVISVLDAGRQLQLDADVLVAGDGADGQRAKARSATST